MADDPYVVLGVKRSAGEEDIRKAFRKLAKELHPDLHPGDTAAAERFKKVSQAYDLLGDADKRRRFDRGEIDASGEPRRGYQTHGAGGGYGRRPGAGAGPAEDMGFGDIFSEIFGAARGQARGAQPIRGRDVSYTLEVDFLEAAGGARKRVTMPDGTQLDISVPAGFSDGQTLRLRGQGEPGFLGGEAGDALVEIKVRPHPEFKREGDNILATVPISLDEAVLGAKVEVATIAGRVNLQIPKGTSSGRVFRLRGKGVHNAVTGATGDHLVTVSIVMPPEIDESLAYFINNWRLKHGYDPRRKG